MVSQKNHHTRESGNDEIKSSGIFYESINLDYSCFSGGRKVPASGAEESWVLLIGCRCLVVGAFARFSESKMNFLSVPF
jgi:hypothetical protein